MIPADTVNINVRKLESVFGVKRWMEGDLHGQSGTSTSTASKIKKDESGKAVIPYKKWSSSEKWMPKSGMRLFSGIPKGSALLVKPQIARINLGKIQQDLPKHWLKFDDDTRSWWSSFIGKPLQWENRNATNLKWNLDSSRPNKPGEPVSSTRVASSSHEELVRLFTKKQREVEETRLSPISFTDCCLSLG